MQQTTYGEIPKKQKTFLRERKCVEMFLEENRELFNKIGNTLRKECIYTENSMIVNDPVINYLNVTSETSVDRQLRLLLSREYEKLEKFYPKLGSIFLEKFFNKDIDLSGEDYLFHQDTRSEFLDTLSNPVVKNIFKTIESEASLEYNVTFQSTKFKDAYCVKTKDINFRIDYDSVFLGSKDLHAINNFRFIIIDGQIESIGEIYHLLYEAAESKVPHVIFCFGMSDEVKSVIIQNNAKSITEIMPVCLKYDENTINILNDLAVLLQGDVVSAQKGQTISQEVRKKLLSGKQIIFDRSGFVLTPNASENVIRKHKAFLDERISNTSNEHNRKVLIDRVKRIACKSLKFYIPDEVHDMSVFLSEIDYVLRFLKFASDKMIKIKSQLASKTYYFPKYCLDLVELKVKSLDKTYEKIEKIILVKEDTNAGG